MCCFALTACCRFLADQAIRLSGNLLPPHCNLPGRFKADEAYLAGQGKRPLDTYLDIDGIIAVAKRARVDANIDVRIG
jgi:hypothetical protein